MNRDLQGHYITISTVGERAQAFVPAPLPPVPPVEWSPELREKFDQALLALGRLDSVSISRISVLSGKPIACIGKSPKNKKAR